MRASTVTIKTEQDLEKLRISGRLAAQVLEMIEAYIKPGVSTEYLDNLCNDYIVNNLKVIPANVGYHGFTKTICTSVNEVVCHGIPSPNKILKDGDIINIDVAIIKDGYFGDTSRMYFVGNVNPQAKNLLIQHMKRWLPVFIQLSQELHWVILVMLFNRLLTEKAIVLFESTVDMELVRSIMNNPMFCTMGSVGKVWC